MRRLHVWLTPHRIALIERTLLVGLVATAALHFAFYFTLPGAWVSVGVDRGLYADAAERWMRGGSYFLPWQLTGPYTLGHGEPLYPPVALLLFAPFAMLPAVVWWLVPLGLLAAAFRRMRPGPWGLVLIAFAAGWPRMQGIWIWGNPEIWLLAAVAWGLLIAGPAAFVLVKPTLAPFALIGASRRRWWVVAGLIGLASLGFGHLWAEWITAVVNSGSDWTYSLPDIPLLLVPVGAWLAGPKGRQAAERWVRIRPVSDLIERVVAPSHRRAPSAASRA